MLKVEEVRTIKVTIDYTPHEWDPYNITGAETTRAHKAKLLNKRVMKYAPELSKEEFYSNISRFADEQGFGNFDVIREVTDKIYDEPSIIEEYVE